MKPSLTWFILCHLLVARGAAFSEEKKLNNLVSQLLEVSPLTHSSQVFSFHRPRDGWIFISWKTNGDGTFQVVLDSTDRVLSDHSEAMRYLSKGEHVLQIECSGPVNPERLEVRAIPELMHCGLGFNPEIKSYGLYDWGFLRADILPNVTTLIVPGNLKLADAEIERWHGQGRRFVAEVGIDGQAKTAKEHAAFWTSFYEKAPFLDGIIINEFIVNRPVVEWAALTPERLERMERERQLYVTYGEALQKVRAEERYKEKMLYAYVGGSGKKLNQEIIGTNFVRTIKDCGYRVALERYLHEMSSPKGSQEAVQMFLDGIADWKKTEPGITDQMVIVFGLFSMPPGTINKQPGVDYHVWMDQQMNLAANHPTLAGIAGLNWWTSLLADEETVRFVGKLYRHYGIEGRTEMFTHDPLFLRHIQNADFEKGPEGWTFHPAGEGTIAAKSFPRYGRIEGRYMGLGRPADPEHIGDTFLWMKRDPRGPNTFSQTIRDLQPGRLYSMKMLACDYEDLVKPKRKTREQANKFTGSIAIENVETVRSFEEMYSSSPEPEIPVWITYHGKVFRANERTATLTVSDWADGRKAGGFGQEQAFNFIEVQPYHQ